MSKRKFSTAFPNDRKGGIRKKRRTKSKPYTLSLRGSRLSGVSDVLKTELYYDEQWKILAAASGAIYGFRGNDCYDPDLTGGGHQPLGFDQLMSLYTRFKVSSSQVDLKIQRATDACEVVLCPTQDTSPTIINIAEQEYSKIMTVSSTISNHRTISWMSTKQILGLNSLDSEQLMGTASASPNRQWYWLIGAYSYDSTTTIDLFLSIRIKYYVEFYERKTLGQS